MKYSCLFGFIRADTVICLKKLLVQVPAEKKFLVHQNSGNNIC